MKKTSLTRALFVAGMMAAAGGLAHADAIFYPDGTSVNLGPNAVENGLASQILAQSPNTAPSSSMLASLGVSADQSQTYAFNPMIDDTSVAYDQSVDTTTLGAGPAVMPGSASTTTTVTTSPVYVFPNINFDRATVMSQPHPMMSRVHGYNYNYNLGDKTAAATFDTPQRAGEMSTMTGGAPNLVTTNENVAVAPSTTYVVPSAPVTTIDTTTLGAGPADMMLYPPAVTPDQSWSSTLPAPSNQQLPDPVQCGSSMDCHYLPD